MVARRLEGPGLPKRAHRHQFLQVTRRGRARGVSNGDVVCSTKPALEAIEAVSYTHLDVYKRQVLLAAGYLRRAADWLPERRGAVWNMLFTLGVTALASAAFLRWFA